MINDFPSLLRTQMALIYVLRQSRDDHLFTGKMPKTQRLIWGNGVARESKPCSMSILIPSEVGRSSQIHTL